MHEGQLRTSDAQELGGLQPYELTLDKFIAHAAKWHPRGEVVTGGGAGGPVARIDYAALRERSNLLSGAFAALGIARGDRIATLAWNSQSHMEAWYGAMGIGVSCHTLNPRLGVPQLADMIRQADDRLLAISPDQADIAAQLVRECPGIAHILVLDEPGSDFPLPAAAVPAWTMQRLLAEHGAAAEWGGISEREEAGLCFTSGTTGAPKGVPYTHRCNYLVTLSLLQNDVMGINARDTILAAVPMFHANGWGLPFAAPASGAKLVFSGRHNDGASLAALIRDEGVTLAVGVPTVWLGLIEHLEKTGETLPSLQRVLLGGSGVPQALIDRIETRLGVRCQTSWGMTELAPLGTVTPSGDAGRASIAGRPPIGVDLRLVDAEGQELAEQRGVEGHLQVRGSSTVHCYFGQQIPATDRQGWFDTGDLATIDADGNLAITGRAKDLIKSGGEWINPGEIEAIIGNLPGVSLVAVIGRAHVKWTERPVLVIEGAGASDEAIRAALDGAIPRWWMPDAIERVERMPLAMTGKIDKQALRRRFGTDPANAA
ncbi:AMP-binding protein [Sphingomonas sp. HITSZ_GF]|uniref:AMP-binding protein n=1 Tax=Sphingomonas sp. HITSZ_GF TaxID=3037247 RepID=UPI00240D5D84|nr:AMP-binding protein [Sphingomonas sp. HITSZ_GF]MDG2535865.1 AMP-binding protein [Sphingomonas sp. HITSZ_GF]